MDLSKKGRTALLLMAQDWQVVPIFYQSHQKTYIMNQKNVTTKMSLKDF